MIYHDVDDNGNDDEYNADEDNDDERDDDEVRLGQAFTPMARPFQGAKAKGAKMYTTDIYMRQNPTNESKCEFHTASSKPVSLQDSVSLQDDDGQDDNEEDDDEDDDENNEEEEEEEEHEDEHDDGETR